MGGLAERVRRELGAEVKAIDISPRMVALTRARGVDAQVADLQQLPFGHGEFDCVAANWVLYHAPDLERGVAELARVLRRYFVAVERREANGTFVFPDRTSMHEFVAATTTRSHLADRVPDLGSPIATRSRHCVFVAEKAS